jgi:hypothetical protein
MIENAFKIMKIGSQKIWDIKLYQVGTEGYEISLQIVSFNNKSQYAELQYSQIMRADKWLD